MAEEIELKLALDPADMRRLPDEPVLRDLVDGEARCRHLSSTYFDTSTLTLRQHGIALRVRSDGEGLVQTLKAPIDDPGLRDADDDGLQRRREFEVAVEDTRPHPERIDDPGIRALLASERVAGQLEPVFVTEFDRRAMPLVLAGTRIELALDHGAIRAGGIELPLCEAELELQAGDPVRLYELALLLHRAVPFRLERESKAARGYRLYTGERPLVRTAEPPRLMPDMPVTEACGIVVRECVARLRDNELAALDGRDRDAIDEMRQATRRLRMLIEAFGTIIDEQRRRWLRAEVSWLQRELGPLHDAARAPADAAIRSQRYTALLLQLSVWLQTGGRPAA